MSTVGGETWSPDQLVHQVDLSTLMLLAGVRAAAGRDCADLDLKSPAQRWWRPRRASSWTGIPRPRVADVHGSKIAAWMADAYPARRYPAVVIGSPHAGALHLATALGAPWLPAGFRLSVRSPKVDVRRPYPALRHGRPIAANLLDGDAEIAVYQRCDPLGTDSGMLDFYVKWTTVPPALRQFLSERLAPDATVLLIRDCRGWPATRLDDGYRFQVGAVDSGLSWPDYCRQVRQIAQEAGDDSWSVPPPDGGDLDAEQGIHPGFLGDLRRWSGEDGRRLRIVATTDPNALSAAVADVYRSWLRDAGKTGNRLVIGCGSLLDPLHVIRAGLVPYWSPRPLHGDVEALEYWLAGSEAFRSIDVLVEPPGRLNPPVVSRQRLVGLSRFATDRGHLDPACRRRYPLGMVDACHASRMLREQPYDVPTPPPLTAGAALEGVDRLARYGRLLVI